MNDRLTLFLPCAGGVQDFLADEVHGLTGLAGQDLLTLRGGVRVRAGWRELMLLNLQSRLAQRVLIELAHGPCAGEDDLYRLAHAVPWEQWFAARQTFKVELTAQRSPLKSLNFAALRVKDAVADRFRAHAGGGRPSVDTRAPEVRVQAHLTAGDATLYIDTSGQSLFKRGWRQQQGDAPLKETLAAAMLAASGWWLPAERRVLDAPLYDPCCGSGTIVIEAAQLLLGLPAGGQRHFAFEHLKPHDPALWNTIKKEAVAQGMAWEKSQKDAQNREPRIFGSDVAHRMVDFAQRNAERAGVAHAVQLRGGDALQRLPPANEPGVLLLNPPYGERIDVAGSVRSSRESFASEDGESARAGDLFFERLAAHWKQHFAGWSAWLLTPDLKLPARLRLKESRRVPLWNGPIECRLFRFDMVGRNPVSEQA
ncbi:MAG: THUMP domain-containing protein [Burkholderiaceae bacterium]|jgi:putative N6-adenine-specific DNA methylase|nr:THUMP domain-containing protein [Burkholderiaceae bacterium]